MAYAGRMEDMRPEDRYDSLRLRPLIEQTVKEPWLREAFLGLLYRVEELERKRDLDLADIASGAQRLDRRVEKLEKPEASGL